MNGPIFLLASERSGTNLLRRRLNEAQGYAYGPVAIHILKHLYYAEPYYGTLGQDCNFNRLIEDALKLAYTHFSPWDIRLDTAEIRDACDEINNGGRSSLELMHTLYTLYARAHGYQTYFCKDNNLFDFVPDIRMALPEARFVYLYRDPRDVVLSNMKRPLSSNSVLKHAATWRDEQIKCIAHANNMKKNETICLSYEALLNDEATVIGSLCNMLQLSGLTREPDVRERGRATVHEWSNLDEPTLRGNTGKYKKYLKASQTRSIEALCWHQMKWLGYTPEHADRPSISTLARLNEAVRHRVGGLALRSNRLRNAVWKRRGVTSAQVERMNVLRKMKNGWR